MPKKPKVKIKSFRDEPEDFPKDPSLYKKACMIIKSLNGSWEIKKGKIVITKKKKKKAKKKSFDLR